jgi:hypothetical protein
MLYDLVFHLNLNVEISNQLDMVIIITLFHLLKALSLFSSMNYIQALSINFWLARSAIFFFYFTKLMKIISFKSKCLMNEITIHSLFNSNIE